MNLSDIVIGRTYVYRIPKEAIKDFHYYRGLVGKTFIIEKLKERSHAEIRDFIVARFADGEVYNLMPEEVHRSIKNLPRIES